MTRRFLAPGIGDRVVRLSRARACATATTAAGRVPSSFTADRPGTIAGGMAGLADAMTRSYIGVRSVAHRAFGVDSL